MRSPSEPPPWRTVAVVQENEIAAYCSPESNSPWPCTKWSNSSLSHDTDQTPHDERNTTSAMTVVASYLLNPGALSDALLVAVVALLLTAALRWWVRRMARLAIAKPRKLTGRQVQATRSARKLTAATVAASVAATLRRRLRAHPRRPFFVLARHARLRANLTQMRRRRGSPGAATAANTDHGRGLFDVFMRAFGVQRDSDESASTGDKEEVAPWDTGKNEGERVTSGHPTPAGDAGSTSTDLLLNERLLELETQAKFTQRGTDGRSISEITLASHDEASDDQTNKNSSKSKYRKLSKAKSALDSIIELESDEQYNSEEEINTHDQKSEERSDTTPPNSEEATCRKRTYSEVVASSKPAPEIERSFDWDPTYDPDVDTWTMLDTVDVPSTTQEEGTSRSTTSSSTGTRSFAASLWRVKRLLANLLKYVGRVIMSVFAKCGK